MAETPLRPVGGEDLAFDDDEPVTPPAAPASAPKEAPAREVHQPNGTHQRRRTGARRDMRETDLPPSAPDRAPPHSPEAEEHVIACCLLDGTETIVRCLELKLTSDSFYSPANRLLFSLMCELHQKKNNVTLEMLCEELKTRRLLEAVGGWAYMMQITGRIPTTAHAGYFIDVVKEKEMLREIIKAATGAVEQAYSYTGGGLDELLQPVIKIGAEVDRAIAPLEQIAKPITAFEFPSDTKKTILIGTKHRYLGRGGAALVVAPAGIGKSSTSIQWGCCMAIGKPFLGIDTVAPLRILLVQAEDDDGDIGEIFESIKQGMDLGPIEMGTLDRNFLVIRDRTNTNEAFIVALRTYVRQFKPDIVMINPLMAYCSGLSEEKVAGPFLYGGLNKVNAENLFAYIIFHHTPKPPAAPNPKITKGEFDHQYSGFGSSILSNWPRAVIIIEARKDMPGQFIFRLAKRGKRAGVVERVKSSEGAFDTYVPTTTINAQHSNARIKVKGKDFPRIMWETSVVKPPEGEGTSAPGPKRPHSGGKVKLHSDEEVLALFPLGEDKRQPIGIIKKKAFDNLGMKESTFMDYRFRLVNNECTVKQSVDGLYFRPNYPTSHEN